MSVYYKKYISDNVGDYPVYSSQTANNGILGKINSYDYDGNYQDSYLLGDQITYSDSLTLSFEDVGSNSRVTDLLTDIYNAEYWTPALEQ